MFDPMMLAGVWIPPPSQAAVAWNHAVDVAWGVNRLVEVAFFAWIFASGAGRRIHGWLFVRRGRRPYVTLVSFGWLCVLVVFLLRLPANWYQHMMYPGSDADTFGEWFNAQISNLAPWAVAVPCLIWLPSWLMRWSPRRWWLWSGALAAPVALLLLFVQPLWESLGTSMHPLDDPVLAAQIEDIASRQGLDHARVMVGGDDTTVIGLGPTNRIVLQADLPQRETPAQIRFTVAHELKHYLAGDNWKAWLIAVALVTIMAGAGAWAMRLYPRAATEGPGTVLPLLMTVWLVTWIVFLPTFLAFNRTIERDADRFALNVTHENDAAIALFRTWLNDTELPESDLFGRLFRANHPSTAERIRMADALRDTGSR